jgi:hypothetical protein
MSSNALPATPLCFHHHVLKLLILEKKYGQRQALGELKPCTNSPVGEEGFGFRAWAKDQRGPDSSDCPRGPQSSSITRLGWVPSSWINASWEAEKAGKAVQKCLAVKGFCWKHPHWKKGQASKDTESIRNPSIRSLEHLSMGELQLKGNITFNHIF